MPTAPHVNLTACTGAESVVVTVLSFGMTEASERVDGEAAMLARLDPWLDRQQPATPCIVMDLTSVRARYRRFQERFPTARIYYAVKANPDPQVLAALAGSGACFDVASMGEITRCLGLGIAPERLSFGNTIKRDTDVAAAAVAGVGLFAFDSAGELEKLARAAPGATVFCRLLVRNTGAAWPLSRKFGCSGALAADLLLQARSLGLRPAGVSFHVGSQQTEPGSWADAIGRAARVFQACARQGLDLTLLNLGGGFPARYATRVPPLEDYGDAVDNALRRHFGAARPQLIVEPGRGLVADAGLLRTTVLLVARKSRRSSERWVFLDSGRYNGLMETTGERIRYRLRFRGASGPCDPAVLAGPTCDSADVIYAQHRCLLPRNIAPGAQIDFLSAGAYTGSYASVDFNGFPPLQTYCA